MLATALARQARAGGLWLSQFGDFAARAVAGVDEATTIIHNPAGSQPMEGSQLFLAAGVILTDIAFEIEDSNPINLKHPPHAQFQRTTRFRRNLSQERCAEANLLVSDILEFQE